MKRAAAVLTAAFLLSTAGCGYRTDGLYRDDVSTVYVEMFASKEFRRELEFVLTESVKKRINTHTPYRLAPKERADTILRGEILEQRSSVLAPDFETRLPRDIQITIAVRVQWQDVRNGRILFDQPVLLQSGDYLPPAGESERFAQERVLERLAARIVAQMYDDW